MPSALNREDWLTRAGVILVRDILAPNEMALDDEDRPLVDCVKVSCSWPHKGGVARKKQRIGECWGFESSEGGVHELFISPVLSSSNTVKVLGVLLHELLHAHFPRGVKHNRTFAAACRAVGLEGKPTATVVGDELALVLAGIADDLGEYPHKELRALTPEKKQGTRDRKVFCDNTRCPTQADGGLILRMTKKWMVIFADPDSALEEDAELPMRVQIRCPACEETLAVEGGGE